MRRFRLLILTLLVSLFLAACGASDDSPTELGQPDNGVIRSNPNQQPRAPQPTPLAPDTVEPVMEEPTEEPADVVEMEAPPAVSANEMYDSAAPQAGMEAQAAPDERQTVEVTPEPDIEQPIEPQVDDSMFFQNYGINPFISASDDNLSTFAMDVDTASYSLMRTYVDSGSLPPADSVRVEEYLNYFDYGYPQPETGDFAVYAEAGPSPFGGAGYELIQFGIQGRTIADTDRKPAALTFVIDVSGSMEQDDRLGAVKFALGQLVGEMREDDTIAIAVYGSHARVVLPPTSGAQKDQILGAINNLRSEGSTNVQAGLAEGFDLANQGFKPEGINMIILCSDGVANNGVTDPQALLDLYAAEIDKGVQLSTYGFGMGNYNDILMEQLANGADGAYAYIDTPAEAERVFVQNLTGTLQTIARDAKIQVEFNPEVVQHYRLVGYENRDVADQDFRNDTIDAGEVGAGHSVTAMYEIKRFPGVDGDVAVLRLRYQPAEGGDVIESAATLNTQAIRGDINGTSPAFKLAASVTHFAELMRHSHWVRDQNLENLIGLATQAADEMPTNQDVAEYRRLLMQATQMTSQ